jgi:hypothetical protein
MRSIRTRGLMAVIAIVVIAVAGALVVPEIKAQQVSDDADTAEIDARLVDAKGAWSPNKNYLTDDLVTSRGSTWRAKRNNKGKVPGSTQPSTAADWELFAAGFNPVGAWLGTKKYHINDLVSFQGATWRAKRTSQNKTPVAGANWQQFAARGAAGATGATGPQGPAGPNSVASGTAGAPSFSFTGDSNTGIFSPSAGKIALVEDGALFLHGIGFFNTALGSSALQQNTGIANTALGTTALLQNTTGNNNTAVGSSALQQSTTGKNNTAVGANALFSNTAGGDDNTALGFNALGQNTTGTNNTALGRSALAAITNGDNNIALGASAGVNSTASSSSIFIGNAGLAADTVTIKIGAQGLQTSAFIAGISGATSTSGIAVLVNSSGQLGTTPSSRRYKDDIEPMGDVSAALLKLRPVTFRYKQPDDDGSKPLQYGLIAEEVAEVLPGLAVFNKDGTPETVKYHLLPSFLLAGYQQQQKIIETQAERDRQQQKTIEAQAEQLAALEQRLLAIEALLPRVTTTAAARQ